MQEKELNIKYEVFDLEELSFQDKELIINAQKAIKQSYSPYSHFKVGCAVRLYDDSIVLGANQENAAYPSGLCAERTALFSAAMQYNTDCNTNNYVITIAITAQDKHSHLATAYPCGACRQVMMQTQIRTLQAIQNKKKQPIRVLIHTKDNNVIIFNNVMDLLPFSFDL